MAQLPEGAEMPLMTQLPEGAEIPLAEMQFWTQLPEGIHHGKALLTVGNKHEKLLLLSFVLPLSSSPRASLSLRGD